MNRVLVPLLVSFLAGFCSCKNILVLEGLASPSHHVFLGTLNRALAARGYNVTSLCAEEEKNSPNLTYLHLDQVYQVMYNTSNADFSVEMDFFDLGDKNAILTLLDSEMYYRMFATGILKSKGFEQLKNYPKDFKFDLVINDYLVGPLLLPFVHHFNYPPLVGVTAFHSASTTHNILGSLFYPFRSANFFEINCSTFLGRVYNFIVMFFEWAINEYQMYPIVDEMLRQEFPDSPFIGDMMSLHKLVMTNKHSVVDEPEPVLPSLIAVGGLQITPPKPLPQDLQDIMDGAKKGVILFSLGTNVKSSQLGERRLEEIIEALRQLPEYTIIWKFESQDITFNIPDNVIIRPWLPQSDILAHPNTILFITHAGLLSTQEATWRGVPLLNLPIFADQATNAKLSVAAGVGETYSIRTVERNSLKQAILKVIENPKYREKAKIRSRNFQDQPQAPLDRAIWWIEWLMRNPDVSFLRSSSLDLNMMQRHSIDIIAFLTVVSILWIALSLWMTSKFVQLFKKLRKTKKAKKE